MQPEPLLRTGFTSQEIVAFPRPLGGVYSAGDPVNLSDTQGTFAVPFVPVLLVIAEVTITPTTAIGSGAAIGAGTGALGARLTNVQDTRLGNAIERIDQALSNAVAAVLGGEGAVLPDAASASEAPTAHGTTTSAQDVQDIDAATPPFQGEAGTTVRGGKQSRTYGPDGYPQTDRDLPHQGEKGKGGVDTQGSKDHSHDWGRPEGGGKPTKGDRGRSREPKEGDPPAPRGYGD
jgi:hypothetical protein